MQAEDAALRWVENRRREHRAVDAAVGNGEHAALQVLERDLAGTRFFGEAGDFLFEAVNKLLLFFPFPGPGLALLRLHPFLFFELHARATFELNLYRRVPSARCAGGQALPSRTGCAFLEVILIIAAIMSETAGVDVKHMIRERANESTFVFESELGQPKFDSASIPMLTDEPEDRVIDYRLNVGTETLQVTALQMGNPNCCIFVEDFEAIDWRRIGPLVENHPQFPERTVRGPARRIQLQAAEE